MTLPSLLERQTAIPAPSLPLASAATVSHAQVCRRTCAVPASWPRESAASLCVAVFADVLRTWCAGTQRFALRIRSGDGGDSLLIADDLARFGERHASIARQLQDSQKEVTSLGYPVTVAESASAHENLPEDVSLELRLVSAGFSARCEWHSRDGDYPPGLVEDMFDAFQRLMNALAADGDWASRHRFDLLPKWQLECRTRVNDTETPISGELLHTAVAAHARLRPDALAVITPDRQLSYHELSSRVNQVARKLRELGVRQNQLVAVAMERGWEQIVAVHAVVTAGAAYLPVDVTFPPARMRTILKHGEVSFVLTQSAVDQRAQWPASVRALCVDCDFDDMDDSPLEQVATPTDLAYVIFTSGSTGMPKGVMVDHRGAVNCIDFVNRRFAIGPDDRGLALSGLHFDLSVYDTFGLLAAGGAVVVPRPTPKPDPKQWSELIADFGVTFWNSVPAFIEIFVLYLELSQSQGKARSLRTIILSGDWLPVTLPDRIRAINGHISIYSAGGPAETCIWSVLYPIGEVDPSWTSIPYGRAIANQQYHILDEELQPCPVWVPGEMYVVSEIGLAHGYWRDAGRTARQFISLPSGQRAYATGDLGRFRPDGDIEILGRTDFQVKIQGVRIELGEIEAAMRAYPGVSSAVVVATNVRNIPTLHGYLACESGAQQTISLDGLRVSLLGTLPAYMVPANITVLADMPLTGNGKTDRRALIAAAEARRGGHHDQE